MSSYDKLIAKILAGRNISYKDAEKILISLDFELSVTGSHHIFRKKRYHLIYKAKILKKQLLRSGAQMQASLLFF